MALKISIIRQVSLLLCVYALTLILSGTHQVTIAHSEMINQHITVVLKDFFVHPNTTQAKAGRITLEAVNEGMSTHELVVLKRN